MSPPESFKVPARLERLPAFISPLKRSRVFSVAIQNDNFVLNVYYVQQCRGGALSHYFNVDEEAALARTGAFVGPQRPSRHAGSARLEFMSH